MCLYRIFDPGNVVKCKFKLIGKDAVLTPREIIKKLLWVSGLAIFSQLLLYGVCQLASEGAVKVALGEGIIGEALFYPVILKAAAFFLLAQAFCYGLLIAIVLFCCWQLKDVFTWFRRRLLWMPTLLWLIAFSTCFVGNILFYPNSFFSAWITRVPDFYPVLFPRFVFAWALLFVLSAVIVLGSLTIYLSKIWRNQHFWRLCLLSLFCGFIPLGFALHAQFHASSKPTGRIEQPNLIIIGIDALRPDYITPENTPHLYAYLKESVVFNQTLTPLARTFPAWVSILTGRYPKFHGARFNLDAPEFIQVEATLPKLLREEGYETWFVMDETRFSNIGNEYGFDHRIVPREGINDFLLGTINDFPISNMLVNSWVGEKLFPYSFANRAAYVTYRPKIFVQHLEKTLPDQSQLKRPMFLAMHLLISHWPNEWADSRFSSTATLPEKYRGSIHMADKQWAAIMAALKKKHLLDNAIIVVLSDHGEALGMPGDKQLNEKLHQPGKDNVRHIHRMRYSLAPKITFNYANDYGIDTSYGHGTDVLSPSQYKTLLAWQGTGEYAFEPRRLQRRVSLLDIAPTLLSLIEQPVPDKFDGISLKENLLKGDGADFNRVFYSENGYKLAEIETDNISVAKVLEKSIHAYNINAQTGKLTMKSDLERIAIKEKEFSVIQGDWQLAVYPSDANEQVLSLLSLMKIKAPTEAFHPRWFILNLKTGEWSSDLNSSWARTTPAKELKKKLLTFYGKDINA